MDESEKAVILRFARGHKALRESAIDIYHKNFHEWISHGDSKCPYMRFMSEIHIPVPDLGMRAHWRAAVIEDGLDAS